MNNCPGRTTGEGCNYVRSRSLAACFPLLQLYYHNIVMARVINSGNQEVNTLGCQWNLILYCNLAQIINLRHIDHVSQILH